MTKDDSTCETYHHFYLLRNGSFKSGILSILVRSEVSDR